MKKREPRWIKAYHALVCDASLSTDARLICIFLRSFCRRNGSVCFPSYATIQTAIGCSRRSLISYLDELERAGWLRKRQRIRPSGRFTSNQYELLDDSKSLVKEAFQERVTVRKKRHTVRFIKKRRKKPRLLIGKKAENVVEIPCAVFCTPRSR